MFQVFRSKFCFGILQEFWSGNQPSFAYDQTYSNNVFLCSSPNLLEASTPEEPEPEDELSFDDIEAEFLNIQMTQDALQGILNSLEEDKRNLLDFTMDNHEALNIVEEEEDELSSELGIKKVHT